MTISERTREVLEKLKKPNGEIITTEDMSADLREAIEYINANNIDIFNAPITEPDEEEIEEIEETDELSESESDDLEPLEPFDESELVEDLEDSDVEELGDFL